MSITSRLEEAYKNHHFKEGASRKVDELILTVRECLQNGNNEDFKRIWADFVEVVLTELPNISHYNISDLELILMNRGLHEENLFVLLVCAHVSPNSTEANCFLGHAYGRLKKYELAIPCYRRAYELAVGYAQKSDSHSAYWLDASDYLRHLALCEVRLGRLQEALLTLSQSMKLLNHAHCEWKKDEIFRSMSIVFRLQKSPLAKVYYRKALEYRKKR